MKFLQEWFVWAKSGEAKKRQTAGGRSISRSVYQSALLPVVMTLLLFGLVMVASASMPIAERLYHDPFHYLTRQLIFATLGFLLGLIVLQIPLHLWEKMSPALLLGSAVLLVLVLLVGVKVNGASRWIPIGPFRLQPSEFTKLAAYLYLASYLVRHRDKVSTDLAAVLRPIALLAGVSVLILVEPDLGAAFVMMAVVIGMMWLGGVKPSQFALFILLGVLFVSIAIMMEPFRMARMASFLGDDPFLVDPKGKNYQITQALIAYGRGGWQGLGLGEGLQKLFYLPEAHTDFILAVIAEELGLFGTLSVVLLFSLVVWKAFQIAARASEGHQPFASYLAYGIGIWIGLQALINLLVNVNLAPTKGLTLPLVSYGGSSLIVMMIAIALLMRIEFEVGPIVERKRRGNR
ncbi:MAG: putative lipid II flippase FtsW [Gammaproteobacteria bacterium]|nr:putative lipid II flippase FtsW [Gammaproteobacteria bacterium]MBT3845473.1 putative lipid II flippase FtsW [Gammaproteobacteria bacterium]MBT6478431.1 putative lipid II flippase FtsW [Gammaproteobacteria bacterium]